MRWRSQIHSTLNTMMTTTRMPRMMYSCSSVIACSVAKNAAIVTKIRMPPTQAMIARIDCFVGRWPETRAFSSVVITRAIAPSGWTRMSGATARAPSWQTIARPSMTVPATQDGRRSRASSCPPVRPEVPACPESRSTFATPRC